MTFKHLSLIILFLFAFTLRTYHHNQSPASLYYDEVDYGYQARSLIETGKDYRGKLSPFYVHSFNDVRAPIPAWITVLTTLTFQDPFLQVRLPSAIMGTVAVLLGFYLIYIFTNNWTAALFTGAVMATNPWWLQFSRFSHEGMIMTAIYLAGIVFFFKALKPYDHMTIKPSKQPGNLTMKQWNNGTKLQFISTLLPSYYYLLLATILISLSLYTYRTMSLFAPLTFLILGLIYIKPLLKLGFIKISILFLTAASIISPFLYTTTLGAPDQPRINQLAIFSDPSVPVWVQRHREVDSGNYQDSTPGKQAVWYSFIFHNKVINWADQFANNYLRTWSIEFLFTAGDRNLRHHVGQMGHLLLISIVPLIAGLAWVASQIKQKPYQWLLIWLLIAPIPASLTTDGAGHAARLLTFSTPLLLIVGLGWWRIYLIAKSYALTPIPYILTSLFLINFLFYLHKYHVHYPIDSAREFGYGFQQAFAKIAEVESDYQRIEMTASNDPPMIYLLFWKHIPPSQLHAYGTEFGPEIIKNQLLDKYKVIQWDAITSPEELPDRLESDVLYHLTTSEIPWDLRDPAKVPPGIKIIDIIKYPDNEVAFYLLTKEKP